MTPERRHTDDPHPPEGVLERRHCSDKECSQTRTAWYEETLLPKITNMFWKGVAATIITCLSGLFFIISSLIDRHTLEVERAMQEKYVTLDIHREDIKRLEKSFDKMSGEMSHAMNEILNNQSVIIGAVKAKR